MARAGCCSVRLQRRSQAAAGDAGSFGALNAQPTLQCWPALLQAPRQSEARRRVSTLLKKMFWLRTAMVQRPLVYRRGTCLPCSRRSSSPHTHPPFPAFPGHLGCYECQPSGKRFSQFSSEGCRPNQNRSSQSHKAERGRPKGWRARGWASETVANAALDRAARPRERAADRRVFTPEPLAADDRPTRCAWASGQRSRCIRSTSATAVFHRKTAAHNKPARQRRLPVPRRRHHHHQTQERA